MMVVFIIPTGLGCDIGGHAGDATPAARLIAQCCNKIILHPNVVNASDINEMPANGLYVEGSMLDRFLEGSIRLNPPVINRILVIVNAPVANDTINAVSSARATLGVDAEILQLETPLIMKGEVVDGIATGTHSGVKELIEQIKGYPNFGALAICSEIIVDPAVALKYFRTGGVNPWGGIEAIVSKIISEATNKPVAHAPIESQSTKNTDDLYNILFKEAVDPRMAAEVCSNCYTYCVLKGLHTAPQISYSGYQRSQIGCLITPTGCIGRPHRACFDYGIPVIAVKDNDSHQKQYDDRIIYVSNYIEAAGMVSLLQAGVTVESVTRILPTKIHRHYGHKHSAESKMD